jgi:hypothetical protein
VIQSSQSLPQGALAKPDAASPPELPAPAETSSPPVAETPPKKDDVKSKGVLAPKALFDETWRHARIYYTQIPDMTFALTMAGHAIRRTWDFKDGRFVRKELPFANYVPPKDGDRDQAQPSAPHTARIAEARARWDDAKREGDADRMTRTANDLLRAAEAQEAAPRDPPDAAHHENKERAPISDVLSGDESRAATEMIGETFSGAVAAAVPDLQEPAALARLWTPEPGLPIEHQLRPLLEEVADTASPNSITPVSWTRPVPPSEYYPSQPFERGLERLATARRRRGTSPAPHRGRKHWADPDVGWDQETIDETIGGWGGEVTPELLLIFSQQAYGNKYARLPRDRAPKWSRRRSDGSIEGWQYLGDRKADGYFGMALYNEQTNTVVIASRGTTGILDDVYSTALPITRGEHTRQMDHAQELLILAWRDAARRARARGLPPPRLVLTGHSLGGAMAEVQLARVYADPELSGIDVSVVTFAALGADRVVRHVLSRWEKIALVWTASLPSVLSITTAKETASRPIAWPPGLICQRDSATMSFWPVSTWRQRNVQNARQFRETEISAESRCGKTSTASDTRAITAC